MSARVRIWWESGALHAEASEPGIELVVESKGSPRGKSADELEGDVIALCDENGDLKIEVTGLKDENEGLRKAIATARALLVRCAEPMPASPFKAEIMSWLLSHRNDGRP